MNICDKSPHFAAGFASNLLFSVTLNAVSTICMNSRSFIFEKLYRFPTVQSTVLRKCVFSVRVIIHPWKFDAIMNMMPVQLLLVVLVLAFANLQSSYVFINSTEYQSILWFLASIPPFSPNQVEAVWISEELLCVMAMSDDWLSSHVGRSS